MVYNRIMFFTPNLCNSGVKNNGKNFMKINEKNIKKKEV